MTIHIKVQSHIIKSQFAKSIEIEFKSFSLSAAKYTNVSTRPSKVEGKQNPLFPEGQVIANRKYTATKTDRVTRSKKM